MKIALIGGGGVRTIYFTQAVAKYAKRLGLDHISIMDSNAEKLEIYGSLARFNATQINKEIKVELTNSIEEAVSGADYVVITIRVGGDESRIKDEKIALARNLIGQETTGAGGFSYALRTIPVMLDYCRIIKEKSNNALIFNFTNPAGLVTQALHKHGYKNVIGVCDGPTCLIAELAHAISVSDSNIETRIYGLNHLSWLDGVKIQGKEILGKLIDNDAFLENLHESAMFDRGLIRSLKAIPNAYLYYYYHREKALQNILTSKMTRGELVKDINERMLKALKAADAVNNPEEGLRVYRSFMDEREKTYMSIETGGKQEKKEAVDLRALGIESIVQGISDEGEKFEGYAGVAFNYIEAVKNNKTLYLPLNVANNGSVPGLADDDVVEVTCRIDGNGIQTIKVDSVPEENMLLIKQIKRYEHLTIEAIENKSKDIAIKALMIHPLVNSYSLAKELVNEYVEVFKDFVGEWR
ncbi:MAG: glycoside hydrolase [Clostridia bacterium]|nr:glycoside hydrolase [Clostridia bacterium]